MSQVMTNDVYIFLVLCKEYIFSTIYLVIQLSQLSNSKCLQPHLHIEKKFSISKAYSHCWNKFRYLEDARKPSFPNSSGQTSVMLKCLFRTVLKKRKEKITCKFFHPSYFVQIIIILHILIYE